MNNELTFKKNKGIVGTYMYARTIKEQQSKLIY